MSVIPYILAETDPAKFIGLAVVAVIWVIGMITQAIKKQQEEKNTRGPVDLSEEILRRLPPVQVPPPQQQPKQRPPKLPRQKPGKPDWNTIAKQTEANPRQLARRPAPPPLQNKKVKAQVAQVQNTISDVRPSEVPVVQTMSAAKEAMTGQVAKKKSPFIDARALRRFLNPATLQQQYILTELLQRPMCDREQRD